VKESSKRTLVKSLVFRVLAIILLASITFSTTKDIKSVTLVTLLYHSIQTVIYYLYEKGWDKIKWGRSKGLFVQFSGLSGSGKTTISKAVAERLIKKGYTVELIDGDEYRKNVSKDLGFSKDDRFENINRLGFIGKILSRNNIISIMAVINPYEIPREMLSKRGAKTVYIKCGLEELKKRDPKGLYYRALLEDGHPDKVYNFTGVTDPFEPPPEPDLVIDTEEETIDEAADKLFKFILKNI
jgi:adenylylsulfate kinase